MASVSTSYRTEGGEQLRRLAKRLKAAGNAKELEKNMTRRIRKAAIPLTRDMRAAVRAVEVSSTKGGHARPDNSTNLRNRVASAIRVSTALRGIRVYVSGKAVGPYGSTLALYLDAELAFFSKWRHPVFGNKEKWVTQTGQPWFYVTARKHYWRFQQEVREAIDDTLEKL